jgi:hypothetical protein
MFCDAPPAGGAFFCGSPGLANPGPGGIATTINGLAFPGAPQQNDNGLNSRWFCGVNPASITIPVSGAKLACRLLEKGWWAMKKTLWIGSLLVALVALAACGATTLKNTWKDDKYTGGAFSRIMVVGVGANEANRRSFEKLFAKELGEEGVSAVAGYTLLPDEKKATAESVLAAAKKAKVQAVLVTFYRGMKAQRVQPAASTAHGSNFNSAYNRIYIDTHSKNYYQTRNWIKLETELYTVPGAKKVWSATSGTIEQANMEQLVKSLADSIAKKLRSDGFIGPKPGKAK